MGLSRVLVVCLLVRMFVFYPEHIIIKMFCGDIYVRGPFYYMIELSSANKCQRLPARDNHNARNMRKKVSTQEILLNAGKCQLAFYAVYYIISSLCFAFYRLEDFDGRIPFDFDTWFHIPTCCIHMSAKEKVNFISMEVSFAVSGLVFGLLVRERVWDYALTVSVLHTALSCLVMLNFPLNWSWWVCYALAMVLMIAIGELVALFLKWRGQGKVTPSPRHVEQIGGYLYTKS